MEAIDYDKLLEFAKEYLKSNTFISSRNLAIRYGKYGTRGIPSRSMIWRFSRVLQILRDDGVIERYNSRVHKKIVQD